MDRDQAPDKQEHAAGSRPKKPYIKPAFQFERAFETMALACGKVNQTQAQCRFNKKRS